MVRIVLRSPRRPLPWLIYWLTVLRFLIMLRLGMPITDANKQAELNALLRAAAFTGVASLFLSIHTADPGNTGASEYTTYTGTRPSIAFAVASGSGTATSASSSQQDFAAMGATTITHVGLWSATSAGTFQGGGSLTASKTTTAGDTLRFISGAVTCSIT
jgi:hypothetical protein